MPRRALPMQFSLAIPRKERRSKKYIAERLEHENKMKIGEYEFKPTKKILSSKYAIAKWNELIKIFDGFDFVSTVDIGSIEKYCLTHAEYYELLDVKKDIEAKESDKIKIYHAIDKLKLITNINNKVDLLIKLEDRLFLNPISRLKNLPKKEIEKPKSELELKGFGMV